MFYFQFVGKFDPAELFSQSFETALQISMINQRNKKKRQYAVSKSFWRRFCCFLIPTDCRLSGSQRLSWLTSTRWLHLVVATQCLERPSWIATLRQITLICGQSDVNWSHEFGPADMRATQAERRRLERDRYWILFHKNRDLLRGSQIQLTLEKWWQGSRKLYLCPSWHDILILKIVSWWLGSAPGSTEAIVSDKT